MAAADASVQRNFDFETGDSQADTCPDCNGAGKYPAGTQRAGQPCALCAGSGTLLRQRRDALGNPTRVTFADNRSGNTGGRTAAAASNTDTGAAANTPASASTSTTSAGGTGSNAAGNTSGQ